MTRISTATLLALTLFFVSGSFNFAIAKGEPRTRAQAIEIAKERSGDGRVLSVTKKVSEDGVSFFAVKIISNGRIRIFSVLEFEEE